MQVDTKNRNGRIYPRPVAESQVTAYNMNFIKTSRAMGELNHPKTPEVNPERASHLITRLEFANDTDVVGKAKVLSTLMGMSVRNLLDDGVKLGVSTRRAWNTQGIKRCEYCPE